MTPSDRDRPDPSYAEALAELDDILAQLESATVDVDVLAERVSRGAELIRFCRERLRAARVEVDTVVDELLDDTAGAGNGA